AQSRGTPTARRCPALQRKAARQQLRRLPRRGHWRLRALSRKRRSRAPRRFFLATRLPHLVLLSHRHLAVSVGVAAGGSSMRQARVRGSVAALVTIGVFGLLVAAMKPQGEADTQPAEGKAPVRPEGKPIPMPATLTGLEISLGLKDEMPTPWAGAIR